MPPVPPARRRPPGTAVQTPAKPLDATQLRFWHLLASDPHHPVNALGPDRLDALPLPCRKALATITTRMPWLDATSRATLEAYYASGYAPELEPTGLRWEADLDHAIALMAAPNGDIAALLNVFPQTSDDGVVGRIITMLMSPELKAGEKIRLELLRFIADLKGWRTADQGMPTQATQINIHINTQEPTAEPTDAPHHIEIEL